MKKLLLVLTILGLGILSQSNALVLISGNVDGIYRVYQNAIYEMYPMIEKEFYTKAYDYNAMLSRVKESLLNKNIVAETLTFKGNAEDVSKLLAKLGVSIVSKQKVSDTNIIYGFSTRLKGYIKANGNKINIQIAHKDNKIIVGTPLIAGSY